MYRIGGQRQAYRTLRDTLVSAAKRPVERLRHPGAATHTSERLWALRGVSLEVRCGEVLGIVGRNGSGKSTLLKVLSHITEPSEGRVEIRGRVASLLEVGTGFHGELTGRENIQLSGSIMGMTRAEIRSKFSEIVDFAEIGRFLDTPVKRYSSGMYVRLAFAVAAHLEPDILLVDEVLAVGDMAFQEKCLGKMDDVAGQGRTVLFVSHNLAAVRQLCTRAVVLEKGSVIADGSVDETLRAYMSSMVMSTGAREWSDRETAPHGPDQWLRAVRVVQNQVPTNKVDIDNPFSIEFDFVNQNHNGKLFVHLFLLDDYGGVVLEAVNNPVANVAEEKWYGRPHPEGLYRYSCTFPATLLNARRYFVTLKVGNLANRSRDMNADRVISFEGYETTAMTGYRGVVRVPMEWRGELLQPTDIMAYEEPDLAHS
jgi:lipopolysaccharide transport system ATP-binding protein